MIRSTVIEINHMNLKNVNINNNNSIIIFI